MNKLRSLFLLSFFSSCISFGPLGIKTFSSGEEKEYYSNGSLKTLYHMRDLGLKNCCDCPGRRVMHQTDYDENGKVIARAKSRLKMGAYDIELFYRRTEYYSSGKIKTREIRRRDRVHWKKEYDENGKCTLRSNLYIMNVKPS